MLVFGYHIDERKGTVFMYLNTLYVVGVIPQQHRENHE